MGIHLADILSRRTREEIMVNIKDDFQNNLEITIHEHIKGMVTTPSVEFSTVRHLECLTFFNLLKTAGINFEFKLADRPNCCMVARWLKVAFGPM